MSRANLERRLTLGWHSIIENRDRLQRKRNMFSDNGELDDITPEEPSAIWDGSCNKSVAAHSPVDNEVADVRERSGVGRKLFAVLCVKINDDTRAGVRSTAKQQTR
jgi:hypothetical protein